MSNTERSLAQQLFSCLSAAVNADKNLGTKIREVFNLIVAAGLTLKVDYKATSFVEILTTYTKAGQTDLLEIYTNTQDLLRKKSEGATPEAKEEAKLKLDKLDSQWRNIIRYEVEKLRDKQSEAGKVIAASNKEIAKAAGEAIEKLLEQFIADPSKLTDDQKAKAEKLTAIKVALDTLDDEAVLGIRQITFGIISSRKKAVEEAEKKVKAAAEANKAPTDTK